MIFTDFGDGILRMMAPTGPRRKRIRMPEAPEGKEHPGGRIFILINRSERAVHLWLVMEEKLSLGIYLES